MKKSFRSWHRRAQCNFLDRRRLQSRRILQSVRHYSKDCEKAEKGETRFLSASQEQQVLVYGLKTSKGSFRAWSSTAKVPFLHVGGTHYRLLHYLDELVPA